MSAEVTGITGLFRLCRKMNKSVVLSLVKNTQTVKEVCKMLKSLTKTESVQKRAVSYMVWPKITLKSFCHPPKGDKNFLIRIFLSPLFKFERNRGSTRNEKGKHNIKKFLSPFVTLFVTLFVTPDLSNGGLCHPLSPPPIKGGDRVTTQGHTQSVIFAWR